MFLCNFDSSSIMVVSLIKTETIWPESLGFNSNQRPSHVFEIYKCSEELQSRNARKSSFDTGKLHRVCCGKVNQLEKLNQKNKILNAMKKWPYSKMLHFVMSWRTLNIPSSFKRRNEFLEKNIGKMASIMNFTCPSVGSDTKILSIIFKCNT